MLVGGALFGNVFYERADPFEVYSTLVSRMSVWGRRDGVLVVRSPLANLDTTPVLPGLVGGGRGAVRQHGVRLVQGLHPLGAVRPGQQHVDVPAQQPGAAGLLRRRRRDLRGRHHAHRARRRPAAAGSCPTCSRTRWCRSSSGYVIAHYLSYLVEVGQLTLIQLSDPFSNGSNLLGTGNLEVNYWLSYHPTLLANIKVLAVVAGHVLGVIAAHDRAIRILPPRHQLTGQLPLLVAMIAFTVGGLYLLFAA